MITIKSINKSLVLIAMLFIGFSCADESLDPLQFANMKKGTILALRGAALTSVYVQGKPVSEVFPRIATGTEKFTYEAEILATDPTTVASVDIFVIKRPSLERVLLKNIPASAFAKGAYPNPSTTIELTIQEVFTALGLSTTFPLNAGTVNTLLTTYKFGIGIESDINLTDGTKILASEIVAAGLFQSNQFYPAMILNWAVTDYCTYSANSWAADFDATELSEINGSYGPYDATLTQDGANPNKFTSDNFYDSGWPITLTFTPSTNVATQTVTASGTVTTGSGNVYVYSGSGTYNQCLGEVAVSIDISRNGVAGFDILVWKLVKQ